MHWEILVRHLMFNNALGVVADDTTFTKYVDTGIKKSYEKDRKGKCGGKLAVQTKV